jgi:hypothetical protein
MTRRGRDRRLYRSTGMRCAWCGIEAGNSDDVPVYRYRLQRSAYRDGLPRSVSVGSIGLCDPCIDAIAQPARDYSGRNSARKHRHPRTDGSSDEWHLHGDYRAGHRHRALGPDLGHEAPPIELLRLMDGGGA